MNTFERYEDLGRRNSDGEHSGRALITRDSGLLTGGNFECHVTKSRDLAEKGVLPKLDLQDSNSQKRSHQYSANPPDDGSNAEDPEHIDHKNDVFRHLDSNHDKELTAKEWIDNFDKVAGDDQAADLEEFKKAFGGGEEAAKLFKLADADGDGRLSMMEWLRYFQKLEGSDQDFTVNPGELQKSGASGYAPDVPAPHSPAPEATPQSPYGPHAPEAPHQTPEAPGGQHKPEAPELPRPGQDTPATNPDTGEIARASDAQVQQLFNRIENHGASAQYMQELRNSLASLPSSVVQAAIDGNTRIVAVGQGPNGLGGTYNSGSNTVTMYETSPFDTRSTLSAEMFHNWDLNPFVGRHISSQPWFQDAFNRARQSGIDFGDNTLTNRFEFIHHMARYYSGSTGGVNGQLMDFLGPQYAQLTRQALGM